MAELGLGISLSLKDAFSSKARALRGQMGGMQKEANTLTSSFGKMNSALTAIAGAVVFQQARRALVGLVTPAINFEKAMAEVSTLVDTADVNMQDLGAQALALSKSFGVDNIEQAKALYQTLSAGVGDTAESMHILEVANKLAVGGVTDVATAADGLTTILNAWHLPASQAADVSDILFKTMAKGKTTIGELSSFMFQAAPISSALNVGLEELTAGIVALTKGGTPTSIAMTQVRQAMVSLLNPSDELTSIWNAVGFESGAAAVKTLGLQKSLELVSVAARRDEGTLKSLLGSVEAVNATLSMTGANADMFAQALVDIKDRAGATDEAVAKMQATMAQKAAKVNETLKAMRINIGTKLLAALEPVIAKVEKWIQKLDVFLSKNPKVAKAIGITVAAFAALAIALGAVAVVAGALMLIFSPIGIVVMKLAAIVGVATGAFFGLKSAISAVLVNNQSTVDKIKDAWGSFSGFVKDAWLVFKTDIFPGLKAFGALATEVFYTSFIKPIIDGIGMLKDLYMWLVHLNQKLADFIGSFAVVQKIGGFLGKEFTDLTGINAFKEGVGFVKNRADQIRQGGPDAIQSNALVDQTATQSPVNSSSVNNLTLTPEFTLVPGKIELDRKVLADVVFEMQSRATTRAQF